MKIKIAALLVCIVCTQAAMAQFKLGIKAGTNITKIEGAAFKDEFNYGYHAGAFVEIGLGKKFGIQPEILLNQVKSRVDSSFSHIYQNAVDFNTYKDVKLKYLSIPLVLNYKVGNILSLQAGPQFGILMNGDKTLMQNGKEAFKSGDFSMLGGAQINISKLRLTGRYVVGLNNINDIGDQNKWNNQGFQLSLGLAL
ncbi:MAG TPA: porin family protein [Chitinophagaceae bacterium]|nr:porin family protein [Chitinophagaceae bacterium]